MQKHKNSEEGFTRASLEIFMLQCPPFTSGLVESETNPFGSHALEYKGKFYQVTDRRIPYQKDKTADDRFFILTLIAIAGELDAMHFAEHGVTSVQLPQNAR